MESGSRTRPRFQSSRKRHEQNTQTQLDWIVFFKISFHSIKKKNFSYFNIIYFKEVPIYSYSAGNFHQND